MGPGPMGTGRGGESWDGDPLALSRPEAKLNSSLCAPRSTRSRRDPDREMGGLPRTGSWSQKGPSPTPGLSVFMTFPVCWVLTRCLQRFSTRWNSILWPALGVRRALSSWPPITTASTG